MNPQVSTLSKADYNRDIVTADDLLTDLLFPERDALFIQVLSKTQ